MHVERTIEIAAPPAAVWAVMSDIESWPRWTGTTKSAVLHAPFAQSATATMDINGTPKSVFTVTEVTPGRSFTWETTTRGVKAVAGHRIEPAGEGSRVQLTLDFSGFAAVLFRPMISRVARRNIDLEAEGLKRAAEAQVAA